MCFLCKLHHSLPSITVDHTSALSLAAILNSEPKAQNMKDVALNKQEIKHLSTV